MINIDARELMESGNMHLRVTKHLKALVFDEADRMVASGHFREINYIVDYLHKQLLHTEVTEIREVDI